MSRVSRLLPTKQSKWQFQCELGKMRGTALVGVDGMWGRGMRATEGEGMRGDEDHARIS
jgi:hypothetical protein